MTEKPTISELGDAARKEEDRKVEAIARALCRADGSVTEGTDWKAYEAEARRWLFAMRAYGESISGPVFR